MPYLIGTDEAGYAPNLGPLVISASVWWVEPECQETDLYRVLKSVVCKSPSRPPKRGPARLAIADSKLLYRPPGGLRAIERGVLAALALADRAPVDWFELWQQLDAAALDDLPTMPWHVNYELPLPVAADAEDLAAIVDKTRTAMQRAGVRLVAVRSRAVFPDRFNRSTVELGNKSFTLSTATLSLLADSLTDCTDGPVLVVCDKHGGRNAYGALLQQQFPDVLVEVRGESSRESIYRWGPEERRIECRFRVGAEEFLPTALASMTSKYLREVAMRSFNEFWCGRVQNLAPTAGYPGDAKRFMDDIHAVRTELGINTAVMWRDR